MPWKPVVIVFAALAVIITGCAIFMSRSDTESPDLRESFESLGIEGDVHIGKPVSHLNLTVFPICAKKADDAIDYLTLDEGLEKKLVEVREKQNEEVNEIYIKNTSDRPLYLLGGEIVVGGKQDRIVAQNTIVPPKGEMNLSAFCVEQGRWTYGSGGNASATVGINAHAVFDSVGYLAKTSQRSQAQIKKDQSGNWAEVADTNATFAIASGSGTLSATYESDDVKKKVKPYMDALKSGLGETENLVGFVVAINGEVESCDIFGSPKLLEKLKDKLLNSYVMEALTSGKVVEKKVSGKEVTAWLAEIKNKSEARVLTEASDSYGKRKIEQLESATAEGVRAMFKAAPVHENYFKKIKKK
ncbi:MAG: ARPP-1 family domain-containing protein [Planctomycetota bacterium]|jgi:hypothetical protein